MAAVLDVVLDEGRSHISAQVVVGICCQPEVAVDQRGEGQRLGVRAQPQLLHKHKLSWARPAAGLQGPCTAGVTEPPGSSQFEYYYHQYNNLNININIII